MSSTKRSLKMQVKDMWRGVEDLTKTTNSSRTHDNNEDEDDDDDDDQDEMASLCCFACIMYFFEEPIIAIILTIDTNLGTQSSCMVTFGCNLYSKMSRRGGVKVRYDVTVSTCIAI